ncbi:Rab GTPase domain-containing protein [Cavenderia fasciculata]|uniref:Rab GTPase domain-containing protein n=1 Tax=Cavenderia fasciculata TaxID=261658 RepID=F4PKY6_CACFS|nr:Rab GTPase domain-containing protein [Cavenderia fasciculata]EGG23208.1 Rab GTPase domain-containing protein [Cavenderia fasciculata]|eukprot:XP_004361059.1 Rab GTPase domain-containing protein [Cavenderia fasciculata]
MLSSSYWFKQQQQQQPSTTTMNNGYGSNTIKELGSSSTPNSSHRYHLSDPFDKVRVVVVGDTTVGKSSLIHLICNGTVPERPPSWTLGCNTFLKYSCIVNNHLSVSKDYFIEFVDVGGSAKYKITRPTYYTPINGLVVVYDLTNKNSLVNVKKWIFEVLNKLSQSGTSWSLKETAENPQLLELENTVYVHTKAPSIPLLILGNKCDLYYDKTYIFKDKLGSLSVPVTSTNINCFEKGSDNWIKLDLFFNKIISNISGSKRRSLTNISYQNILNFNLNTPPTSSSSSGSSNNNNNNNNNQPPQLNIGGTSSPITTPITTPPTPTSNNSTPIYYTSPRLQNYDFSYINQYNPNPGNKQQHHHHQPSPLSFDGSSTALTSSSSPSPPTTTTTTNNINSNSRPHRARSTSFEKRLFD